MEKYYAVLTGDIVGSTKNLSLTQLEKVRERLRKCSQQLNSFNKNIVYGNVDFFRGDGWQMVIKQPEQALRSALFIQAGLLAFENSHTRIAIGIGITEKIKPKNISQSTGTAFTLSGHALDQMKRKEHLSIALPDSFKEKTVWLKTLIRLCDAIVGHWKTKQAWSVFGALQGLNQTEIAEQHEPPISQQATAKSLAGSDWGAIETALECFETTNWLQPK